MAVATLLCSSRMINSMKRGGLSINKTYCGVIFQYGVFGRSKSSKTDESLDDGLLSNEDKSKMSSNSTEKTLVSKKIIRYLSQLLLVPQSLVRKTYMSHPKRRFIQLDVVVDSVKYLLQLGFTNEEIVQSLTLCFYPRENIEYGLKKIVENEDELSKVGLVNGYVSSETHVFQNGTFLKNKKLELCLYYLESPFGFNGAGIFPISLNEKMESTHDPLPHEEKS